MTLGQASKTYNIPKTTLHDRVRGKYATDHIGAKTVLSADSVAPLERQPNQSVTPTVMLPNQAGASSEIQPSQSVTPTVILPLQSVAPLDSQPNETDTPNVMLDRPPVTLSVIQPNSPRLSR
ncbi:hypothetical protein DPMN_037738 [Dreissena polymorpha]|uniref:HTH psq-type domain-containing protein n=1 Tax=Dreissena polymorpha TaxID=45954 RepID=A0A9D4MDA0_DREPO|nr:hypothetical protein DPMN_037738 [Dreissena polymorpha]